MKTILILIIILSGLSFKTNAQIKERKMSVTTYRYTDANATEALMKSKSSIKDRIVTEAEKQRLELIVNTLDTQLDILPQGKTIITLYFDRKGKVLDVRLLTPSQIGVSDATRFMNEFKKTARVDYNHSQLSPENKDKDFYYICVISYDKG